MTIALDVLGRCGVAVWKMFECDESQLQFSTFPVDKVFRNQVEFPSVQEPTTLGVSMIKLRVLSVFLGLVCPVLGDTLLQQGQKHPDKLLLNLYGSLYNQKELPSYHRQAFERIDALALTDKDKVINSLIYLNLQLFDGSAEDAKQALANGDVDALPKYTETDIVAHLIRLYQWRNPDHVIFSKRNDDHRLFASFLTIADKVDGQFDAKLDLPNLHEFYKMLILDRVPLPAICFNCRERDEWLDRRTMIRQDKFERELPRKLRKLRDSKLGDEQKLAAVSHFISKNIQPVTDGWQTDYWQTPLETLIVAEGDCEDFAILFVAIAAYLGVETSVVVGDIVTRKVDGKPEIQGHAWVDYRGRMIDPIMTTYRGKILYKPQFMFNNRVADMTLPDQETELNSAVAAK